MKFKQPVLYSFLPQSREITDDVAYITTVIIERGKL